MHKLSLLIVLFVAVSIIPETALAQKATEFYIPVDSSPGLSAYYTWQGTIDTIDGENMIITVTNESGTRSINLTQNTRIWLDKSSQRVKNETGDFDDCQPGLYIEIKYEDNEASRVAEWIKIKVEA